MKFFDSHAHYDDAKFDSGCEALLSSLASQNVSFIVNAGSDLTSSRASVKLAEAFSFIYAAVGTHPHEADGMNEESLIEYERLCGNKKVIAVGETGLDFYYDNSPRDAQRFWFREQLALADKLKLPVIVHSREASAETLSIIKESGARRGVMHCFSGSIQTAREYAGLGFFIGVGGSVTYEKSAKLREVVEGISLDNILIETDAPYLSPAPKRGRRNDSSNLIYVAEAIAKIKKTSVETVAEVTERNAKKLFKIS